MRRPLDSGWFAHLVASYGVALAVAVVAVARGVSARELPGLVLVLLTAPVTVPAWLFLLTPIILVARPAVLSGAQPVGPGVSNDAAAGVGYVLYFALFAVAFRLYHPRLLRRRRAEAGLCPACGYDVRASRDSGRCPECGEMLRGTPVADVGA